MSKQAGWTWIWIPWSSPVHEIDPTHLAINTLQGSSALKQIFNAEAALTGILSQKSDVYAFGVVLLELLTGLDPMDTSRPEGMHSLVEYLFPRITSNNPDVEQLYVSHSSLSFLSHLCHQLDCDRLPTDHQF